MKQHLDAWTQTLTLHPDWKLRKDRIGNVQPATRVFLALLGKELGHLDANYDLFPGEGLIRALIDSRYFPGVN